MVKFTTKSEHYYDLFCFQNLKPKDTCHMTDAKEISKMTSVNINDHSEINNSVDHSSLCK